MKQKTTAKLAKSVGIYYTEAEKIERRFLGLPVSVPAAKDCIKKLPKGRTPIPKKVITSAEVLNEAPVYGSAFTRGLLPLQTFASTVKQVVPRTQRFGFRSSASGLAAPGTNGTPSIGCK